MTVQRRIMRRKIRYWLKAVSERHIPPMLVFSTSAFSIILGVIFVVDASSFIESATFNRTFQYARPEVWGGALSVTGMLLGWLYWLDGTSGRAPAFILTCMYMGVGFTAGVTPLMGEGGLISASAIYTFVGIISAICVFACVPREVPSEPPTDNNVKH